MQMHGDFIICTRWLTHTHGPNRGGTEAPSDTCHSLPIMPPTAKAECSLSAANCFPLLILETTTHSLFCKQLQSETK